MIGAIAYGVGVCLALMPAFADRRPRLWSHRAETQKGMVIKWLTRR